MPLTNAQKQAAHRERQSLIRNREHKALEDIAGMDLAMEGSAEEMRAIAWRGLGMPGK